MIFNACSQNQEAKYFIRSIQGKLRIGLAERTVLIALARSFALANPGESGKPNEKALAEAQDIVKQVFRYYLESNLIFSELPSYELIIPALLSFGVKALPKHCHLTPGIPLKPMLAHPTKSLTEVLDRFDGISFTCEYKYDGERAQIHQFPKNDESKVMVFSRNSENLSAKYPEIPAQMKTV